MIYDANAAERFNNTISIKLSFSNSVSIPCCLSDIKEKTQRVWCPPVPHKTRRSSEAQLFSQQVEYDAMRQE